MIDPISWTKMDISRYGEGEFFGDFIFFLYFYSITSYLGITRIDIANSYRDDRPHDCEIRQMIAHCMYLFSREPFCWIVQSQEHIIEEAHEEKMNHSYKPQWSKCNECVRKERTPSMLYHLSDNVGERKTYEKYTKYPSVNTKFLGHIPSMQKYIPIYSGIEEDKDTKEKKKIRMAHVELKLMFIISFSDCCFSSFAIEINERILSYIGWDMDIGSYFCSCSDSSYLVCFYWNHTIASYKYIIPKNKRPLPNTIIVSTFASSTKIHLFPCLWTDNAGSWMFGFVDFTQMWFLDLTAYDATLLESRISYNSAP